MTRQSIRTYLAGFQPLHFAVFYFKKTGLSAYVTIALQLIVSLLNGIGLLMLIPFLYVVGVSENQADSQIMRLAVRAVESAGINLTLTSGLLLFVGVIVLHAVVRYRQSILQTVIVEEFTRGLRDRVYEAMAHARWSIIVGMKASSIHHTIHGDVSSIATSTRDVQTIMGTILLLLANIAIAGFISIPATLITLVSGVLLLVLLRPFSKKVRESGAKRHTSWMGIYSAVTDHLAGLKISKSYGLESEYINRFKKLGTDLVDASVSFTRTAEAGKLLQQIGVAAALSAFVYVGVAVLELPVPELILLILLFSRVFPQFSALLNNWHRLIHEMPSYEAYLRLLKKLEAGQESRGECPAKAISVDREIIFDHVAYTYGSVDYPALDSINVRISAKHMTAIVGPSGSGKTTLADMMIGLLRPTEGKIVIDGTELSAVNMEGWCSSVGYVPQETFLFHDTIRSNILWGKPTASEAEIWHALAAASADEFVANLSDGLDTLVGDRGIRLSGGERQRIALARALIRRPSLLLLDEATSALDLENELRIQEAIDRLQGELTLVVIAHRLSTIRNADHVIVLKNGRVVEQGPWEELGPQHDGLFRNLIDKDEIQAASGTGYTVESPSGRIP